MRHDARHQRLPFRQIELLMRVRGNERQHADMLLAGVNRHANAGMLIVHFIITASMHGVFGGIEKLAILRKHRAIVGAARRAMLRERAPRRHQRQLLMLALKQQQSAAVVREKLLAGLREHRMRFLLRLARLQPLVHLVEQFQFDGIAAELLLRPLLLRNISANADDADHLPRMISKRNFARQNPFHFARIPVKHLLFFMQHRDAGLENLLFILIKDLRGLRRMNIEIVFPNQGAGVLDADNICGRRVCHEKLALRVLDVNAVGKMIEQRPQQIPLLRQQGFRPLAFVNFHRKLVVGQHQRFRALFDAPLQIAVDLFQAFIEPRVFNRNDGLRRQHFQQLEMRFVKRLARRFAMHVQRPDNSAADAQWNADASQQAFLLRRRIAKARIIRQIVDH